MSEKMSQSDMEIDVENYKNYEIEDGPFRKKIKLENDTTCERVNRKFLDIYLNEHEI